MDFQKELENLINKYSKEKESGTPDFILAKHLSDCLIVYNRTIKARDDWYGFGKVQSQGPVPLRQKAKE